MKERKYGNEASWQKLPLMILCAVLALILILLIFGTVYTHQLLSKLSSNAGDSLRGTLSPEDYATATDDPNPDFTGPSIHPTDVTIQTMPSIPDREDSEEIINILLTGEDRRPGESRQRSDSMILCSFNTRKNTMTMISFLRDTYVYIPGHGNNKLNAAFQFGGAELLNETLLVNFGVHVDGNVMIDFEGFKSVIDLLGGVDISLTEKEVVYLNNKYGWDLVVGMNHLDGSKALAYSRIRYIDMDAMRAGRQRKVLTALIQAYKNQSVGAMVSTATQILDAKFATTNMSSTEIISYVWNLFPILSTAEIRNQQIPAAGTFEDMTVGNIAATKVADMKANREILKQILEN